MNSFKIFGKPYITYFLAFMIGLVLSCPGNASTFGEVMLTPPADATFVSCTSFGTPAASTTDYWIFPGSATKTIEILELKTFYKANSSAPSLDVFAIKRSTAFSGGTSSNAPVTALNSAFTATGQPKIFTANPTTGTSVGTVGYGFFQFPGAVATITSQSLIDASSPYGSRLILSGVNESIAVNYAGTAPSGTVSVYCKWREK